MHRSALRERLRCLATLSLFAFVGCEPLVFNPIGRPRALPPVSDRVRAAYSDAASGRFITLADFESVAHAQIFRLVTRQAGRDAEITASRSRPGTGAGALRVAFEDSTEVLVCGNEGATGWSLTRDWSEYHLFLASVYSPRDDVVLAFGARSGEDEPAVYRRPGLPLKRGWNLLRLDLADMAESVNLTDVRELWFWCPGLTSAVELFFDDLILTDNRKDLFASPDGEPGHLYVRLQGRRLHVGAVNRFELVFSRGRIVQWFDLVSDPDRRRNLAGPGAIGPLPVVVDASATVGVDPDDEQQWRGLGPIVQTRQTVREANAVRVVIEGEWLYLPAPGVEPDETTPRHRTTFTIYPQGRIFVRMDCAVATAGWRAEHVGLWVSTDGDMGFRSRPHPPAMDAEPASYVVYARSAPRQADLLFVLHAPDQGSLLRRVQTARDPRVGTVFLGATPDGKTIHYRGLLAVWPVDLDRPANAAAVALDYSHPATVEALVGQVVETEPGDLNNDGFDEASGCHVLALDGNVGRFSFRPHDRLRFYPAFRLLGSADRDVWAYVQGRQITARARDAGGDWIFQIPTILNRETLIEFVAADRSDPLTLPPKPGS